MGVVILIGIAVGANALVAARSASLAEGGPALDQEARPLPVSTTNLEMVESVHVTRTFSGAVVARRTAALAFEGSGRVVRVLVDEGDVVEEGALMAELDTDVLVAQRAEIASRRLGLQARLDELLAGPRTEVIDAARADVQALEESLALATLQRDRRKSLVDKGTISVEQLDTVASEVKALDARRAAAVARLAELENGSRTETIAAQRGALAEVEAGMSSLDVQIEKAKLIAPFRAAVSARFLDEGVVVSQQMATRAFELVEVDSLEARVGVPVELAPRVRDAADGFELRVRGHSLETVEMRVLPTVDSATRTVTLVFELDDASAAGADARPGDIATLVVQSEEEERGAWIPLAALSESTRGLWSAFAVTVDGRDRSIVERIELEVLRAESDRAFVRGTIGHSTTIVSSGAHRLVPGQWVDPLPRGDAAQSVGRTAGRQD